MAAFFFYPAVDRLRICIYNIHMTTLPEKFTERMRLELGDSYPEFLAQYELPPVRGLRVNTLRLSPDEFVSVSPWKLGKTGILEEGFVVTGAENVGRHPYHAAGLFYMQEPSAMSAVAAASADESGLRVLDMCAAPGGKTGGTAARMKGKGIIVANEIVRKRATLLARNLERLGVTNAAVTSARPDAVAAALPRYFDIVLVDAPCSGEGMFRKDPEAVAEWSPEHVSSCAARQRLILESASECVREGGEIVYSTCTFSREENEGVIEDFISKHGDFSIELMERLYPHTSVGEGHFVCRMRRAGCGASTFDTKLIPPMKDRAAEAAVKEFFLGTVKSGLPDAALINEGGRIKLVPREMPDAVLSLDPVSVGVDLGEMRKGRFEPSHTFFMAALGNEFRRELVLDPGSKELSDFMSGNTAACPEEWRGYCAVSVRAGDAAFPVGFGKAVDGVMKNRLPKGLYVN